MFSFLPVKVIGKENIPAGPVVFVANHQSALDIPVMGSLCNGVPHVWLVMAYYINTPVLGFFIKRMFVSVDQENPTKAARSLIQVLRFVKEKNRHFIIFPEGGRYIDGKIHDFFQGFAIIAKKTERPVVPVYMPNNGKIYPPGSFLIHNYTLKIVIGRPFEYEQDDTDETFTEKVRSWFLQQNPE